MRAPNPRIICHLRPSTSRIAAIGVLALAAGCALVEKEAPPAAANFELDRFLGRWHVIARAPGPAAPSAGDYVEYTRPAADRVEERRYAQDIAMSQPAALMGSAAWQVDSAEPARWRSDGAAPWSGAGQVVLYVAEDYRYALIGTTERGEPRVLARDSDVPEWVYAGLVARLAALEYDVGSLQRVPQAVVR